MSPTSSFLCNQLLLWSNIYWTPLSYSMSLCWTCVIYYQVATLLEEEKEEEEQEYYTYAYPYHISVLYSSFFDLNNLIYDPAMERDHYRTTSDQCCGLSSSISMCDDGTSVPVTAALLLVYWASTFLGTQLGNIAHRQYLQSCSVATSSWLCEISAAVVLWWSW